MNKLAKGLLRPFYKVFLEKPMWWFLSHAKAYFFAEIGTQLGNMEQHLGRDAVVQAQRFAALEERFRQLEAQNAAQWDGLEQLLLAIFRQPDFARQEIAQSEQSTAPISNRPDQFHAASNLH